VDESTSFSLVVKLMVVTAETSVVVLPISKIVWLVGFLAKVCSSFNNTRVIIVWIVYFDLFLSLEHECMKANIAAFKFLEDNLSCAFKSNKIDLSSCHLIY
jgi:hypothetical protein